MGIYLFNYLFTFKVDRFLSTPYQSSATHQLEPTKWQSHRDRVLELQEVEEGPQQCDDKGSDDDEEEPVVVPDPVALPSKNIRINNKKIIGMESTSRLQFESRTAKKSVYYSDDERKYLPSTLSGKLARSSAGYVT